MRKTLIISTRCNKSFRRLQIQTLIFPTRIPSLPPLVQLKHILLRNMTR